MSTAAENGGDARTCPSCGGELRPDAIFCGQCGTQAEPALSEPTVFSSETARSRFGRLQLLAFAVLAALLVIVAVLAVAQVRNEQASRRNAVAALNDAIQKQSDRISALEGQNAVLGKRLSATQKNLRLSKAGVAPLAQRILRSVFTVDTPDGLGTGWAAWIQDGDTYLITANHVAQDAITNGTRGVTVKQKARSWRGTIVKTDSVNDLATIRVHGNIAPPLWQRPDDSITPLAGDQLLLVGSPYGLEGTVTTGVVSRVAYDEIQTDAAANPGNSGGPGLDEHGGVVGVLLSGGGENLNFLVPIQRACVTVRDC
jgi:S1-C subfamily serine protease